MIGSNSSGQYGQQPVSNHDPQKLASVVAGTADPANATCISHETTVFN
jgi:hypothetical protein